MRRFVSGLFITSLLTGGAALAQQPAVAQADCHAAYPDVCVRPSDLQYSIFVEAGTTGRALCIHLGEWEGENPVVLEWNGKYAARKIGGVKGRQNAIAVRVKQGKEPAVVKVYSPASYRISPEWKSCSSGGGRTNIENLQWRSP